MFDGHGHVEEGREEMSVLGDVGKAHMRHRAEVQAMARSIAAGWVWAPGRGGLTDRDQLELDCREIAHAAAFLVGAVDDELEGRS